MKKAMCVILSAVLSAGIFSSCALPGNTVSENSFDGGVFEKETIRILSGSENKELSDILADCSKKTGVGIEMTYKGSVDIMNELKNGVGDYDAVWPASSIWLSLGDEQHIIKHDKSISSSPVVFGIKKSLAENLGFTSGKVYVKDILAAINSGELSFCMTSATQSNSGASAYIGFLYALTGKTSALTPDDLASAGLKENISSLFSGIDRSSGSSDWLKDMFLAGNYDAMVNYESLMSIFMTWDKKPFFAGTYFPVNSRYGMPGFSDLLNAIAEKWLNNRTMLLISADNIIAHLKSEKANNITPLTSSVISRKIGHFQDSFHMFKPHKSVRGNGLVTFKHHNRILPSG